MSNCNNSSLQQYIPSDTNPWDVEKADHLFTRIAFGENIGNVNQALTQDPSDLIDSLFDEAIDIPIMNEPPASYFDLSPAAALRQWVEPHMSAFIVNGFRERMMLFWSNHFVTVWADYRAISYFSSYTRTLQEYSLGNFKEFVRAIGLEDAMLIYLSGFQNEKSAPNENYARELYELFTLGEGNGYTEEDILETARALTGYNKKDNPLGSPISFDVNGFDDGEKTIFGQTGNFGYDDVIDNLFNEKGDLIAKFIVEKIYRNFVHPDLPNDPSIINGLADTFLNSDFELVPMLKELFKSEHFFDEASIGVLIKGPIEHIMTLHKKSNFSDFSFTDVTENRRYYNNINGLGQVLFSPPDVAGWPGDRAWISSPNFINTWETLRSEIVIRFRANVRERFRDLAISLAGESDDVEYVVKTIMNWYLPRKILTEKDYANAIDVFKADVPSIYFEDGTWALNFSDVPEQVRLLLDYIIVQPEFFLK